MMIWRQSGCTDQRLSAMITIFFAINGVAILLLLLDGIRRLRSQQWNELQES